MSRTNDIPSEASFGFVFVLGQGACCNMADRLVNLKKKNVKYGELVGLRAQDGHSKNNFLIIEI